MTCKVLALTRLARPDANLPATTALSLVNKARRPRPRPAARRQRGDAQPDARSRSAQKYEIYPEKAAVHETAEAINASLMALLAQLGRTVGAGAGGRGALRRLTAARSPAARRRPREALHAGAAVACPARFG